MKKKVAEILCYIFAEEENLSLENRLFLSSIVIGIMVCVVALIIGTAISLPSTILIIGWLMFLFLLIVFYFARVKKLFKPLVLPFALIGITGSCATWIFGGGTDGENITIEIVALILALTIVSKNHRIYILSFFLILNIIVYLVQAFKPELIVEYSSESNRWIDCLTSTIYSSVFIYLIIQYLLKQYSIERKRAEEIEGNLIQLNNDKDRLITILGHDLKSPFNTLLGFSRLLKENIHEYDRDEIKSHADLIYKSAQSSFDLVEDLLSWIKAQKGRIPFTPLQLKLYDICIMSVESLNPRANEKNITIKYNIPEGMRIFADMEMLKTILRNLVSNAIKFTNHGGVINISADQKDSETTVTVSDNGVGINPENQAKLFDVSQNYTSKGTEKESGTGLGLLLCKEFLGKHGGRIWVESEYGKGSKFYFSIPDNIAIQISPMQ